METQREYTMAKAKAKLSKKATKNDWWFQDVGDNVMRNAEEISANLFLANNLI